MGDAPQVMSAATVPQEPPPPSTRFPWLGLGAGIVMMVILAALIVPAIVRDGEFTYPLDDSYIHFAIAENLSAHGVLGINPGEFASASSSPIWPVLIAGTMKIVGARIGIPLALTVLIATAMLMGIDRWARGRRFSVAERAGFLAAIIIVVPLPVLVLTGMEHVLQVAASFLLLWLAVRIATSEDRATWLLPALGAAALLNTATRYEGLFVILAAAVVLGTVRRWKDIAVMLAAGAVPLVVTAAVNAGQGWPLVPASVLAKTAATRSGPARYLPTPDLYQWLRTPRLVAVVGLTVLAWWAGRKVLGAEWPRRNSLMAMGALIVSASHLLYASTGFFYRYEAYLIVLNLAAAALCLHSVRSSGRMASMSTLTRLALAALMLMASVDGLRIYGKAVAGMREIHAQQIQMARFAAQACPGCRVAVNDIGAVAAYGGGTVTDVYGLADRDVLAEKLDGTYGVAALGRLTRERGVSLAMVYPVGAGMVPGIPSGWERLGTWRMDGIQVVGAGTVEFYSLDPDRTDGLRRKFARFRPPDGVTVTVDATG